jgi:hypothetical protein
MKTIEANYKPNSCKPVYKFNREGKIVHTYDSMTDAVKGERVAHGKLKELISSKNLLRGHYFSKDWNESAVPVNGSSFSTESEDLELWETENGMFDITGWGKVCF